MQRKFTNGSNFLRHGVMRFTINLVTLGSLLLKNDSLREMFTSNEWIGRQYSEFLDGDYVEIVVLSMSFWRNVEYVYKTLAPLVKVLRKLICHQFVMIGSLQCKRSKQLTVVM